MKNLITLFLFVLACQAWAQPVAEIAKEKNLSLKERFGVMKSKSQTYQDYKVIKEVVLDGVWRITMDSVKEENRRLAETKKYIGKLKGELATAYDETKKTKESVAEIVFDSTHINVIGVNFNKKVFISGVVIIIGSLMFLLSLLLGRLRWVQSTMKDKVELLETLTKEYDEFKHKALDKQMKLSRELQNERNKLQEMRPH